jgi:hypothetical protein
MITQVFHDKKTLGLASNGPFSGSHVAHGNQIK